MELRKEKPNSQRNDECNIAGIWSSPESVGWGEALFTTNYILNKMPHKVIRKTPHELLKSNIPSHKYLKVWECLAKVAVPPPKRSQLDLKP